MNRVGGPRRPQTSFRGRLAITSRPWTLENRAFCSEISSCFEWNVIILFYNLSDRRNRNSNHRLFETPSNLSVAKFIQIRDNDQTGLANFSRRKHEVSLPRHYKDETSRMTDEIWVINFSLPFRVSLKRAAIFRSSAKDTSSSFQRHFRQESHQMIEKFLLSITAHQNRVYIYRRKLTIKNDTFFNTL